LVAISLLAVVYSALVATFARGSKQLAAAGFLLASLCFWPAIENLIRAL
jgi:hypothetical protein